MESDEDLLRRCRAGDGDALAALVRRFQDRVFRLACRVTGDAALAEEAAVAAFAKVWARAGQWREASSAGTWIYQVALRAILDCRRTRRRWWRFGGAPLPGTLPDPTPGPAEVAAETDEGLKRARQLSAAVSELAETDRALVHLYYFEELSLAEIADILGSGRDALKMRLARARQRLRGLLEDPDEPA